MIKRNGQQKDWWERAKTELKKRRIPYSEAARILGVEKATFGHWMVGRREPPLSKLQKLSNEILGMSISELCGEDAWQVVDENERKLLARFRKLTKAEQIGFLAGLGLRGRNKQGTAFATAQKIGK